MGRTYPWPRRPLEPPQRPRQDLLPARRLPLGISILLYGSLAQLPSKMIVLDVFSRGRISSTQPSK